MPKAIFQAAYTLLAFSPFPDKGNYFFVKFLISDIFWCAPKHHLHSSVF